MVRRIIGITGIGLWAGLIALAAVTALQAKTDGKQIFKNLPEGWKIKESFVVPREQTVAIGRKLGGRIKNLSNTIFTVDGKRFQVNIIECMTPRGADKIYKSILKMKADPAFCLKLDNTVVEFVGDDVELAKKAPYELGFKASPNDTVKQNNQLDINAKVAQLNIKTARLDDVIRIFGEPTEYRWKEETFERNNLPDRYLVCYPDRFCVFIANNRIVELRHSRPGYVFRRKLQVGSSLNDVIRAIGKPNRTVVGQPSRYREGILYKDIDGKKGDCYYGRKKRGVRCFFTDYKVSALCVTCNDLSGRRSSRSAAKAATQATGIETLAKDLVNALAKGDYAKAVENFDSTMKKALPAEKLQQVWSSIIAQAGPFVEQLGIRKERILQYDTVFVTCKFKRAVLDAKVVFNNKRQISGLFFIPNQSPSK